VRCDASRDVDVFEELAKLCAKLDGHLAVAGVGAESCPGIVGANPELTHERCGVVEVAGFDERA
jgi:hypothetical protein